MADHQSVKSRRRSRAEKSRVKKTRLIRSQTEGKDALTSSDDLVLQHALHGAGSADPATLRPEEVLRLQQTAGNDAVQRLLNPAIRDHPGSVKEELHSLAARPGSGTVQRLMELSEWKHISKPDRHLSPAAFKKIDDALDSWHTFKDDANIANREVCLNAVETAITELKSKFTGLKANPEIDADVALLETSLKEEKDKFAIIKYLNSQYGVLIKQSRGKEITQAMIQGAGKSKTAAEAATAGLKAVEWTLEELQSLKVSLDNYAPALTAKKGAADQPLKTFSRENIYYEVSSTGAVTQTPTTMGVTYLGREHISMFENAKTPIDFATAAQQFRGTIEHELSHALVEGGKLNAFVTACPFWSSAPGVPDANTSMYWDKTGAKIDKVKGIQKARKAGVEPPPTEYGTTNASEDLAESLMLFLEDPARLARHSPGRFNFISMQAAPLISSAALKKSGKAGVAGAAAEISGQTGQYKQLVTGAQTQLEITRRFRDMARTAAEDAAAASTRGQLDRIMDLTNKAAGAVQGAGNARKKVTEIRKQLEATLEQNKYLLSGWASIGTQTSTAQPGEKGVADQAKLIADAQKQIDDAHTAVKDAETQSRQVAIEAMDQLSGIQRQQSVVPQPGGA